MAYDHQPVQNSEVYLLNSCHGPIIAPPSPPSLPSPCNDELSPPSDELISMTPLELLDTDPSMPRRLATAVHVLRTEATALSHLTRLYETDPTARQGFHDAVETISRSVCQRGHLVFCGVGKSGHVAKKLVATMNSLKIPAKYLHPTEALHGDLGTIGQHDTILLITFSGSTPELLKLIPHFDVNTPLIVMTSHTKRATCPIINVRPDAILLPQPIHQSEAESFGVNAPTSSTTMAIALGDALAMVIANDLHISVSDIFRKYHPGGAIGAASLAPQMVSDKAVAFDDIPEIQSFLKGAGILMSAYRSKSGWVRCGQNTLISPRCIKSMQPDDMDEPAQMVKGLMTTRNDWITMSADTSISTAQELISRMRQTAMKGHYRDDSIIVLMDDDEVVSAIEVGDVV
ncbi:hypothetical protein BJ878DRAFT_141269 [Calycina marina]|uniref:SIS domain-containing protein n=1 Tax=Calycina marina TaxID=1763456 RepID=A0A9P7Z977_9HELO|nr:hypothetical protein BJ878DRAFT_141269 [Calycina marina]